MYYHKLLQDYKVAIHLIFTDEKMLLAANIKMPLNVA
jgi:hypothetical protein